MQTRCEIEGRVPSVAGSRGCDAAMLSVTRAQTAESVRADARRMCRDLEATRSRATGSRAECEPAAFANWRTGLRRRSLVCGCAAASLVLIGHRSASGQVQPDALSPTRLVDAAREAARADRNVESARLFQKAIERDSSLRNQVLPEYADQLTYSDPAAEAVPLYRDLTRSWCWAIGIACTSCS